LGHTRSRFGRNADRYSLLNVFDGVDLMKAQDFLNAGLSHMQDRAATYDKPTGERSMAATVGAFKSVCGIGITEEQGWLFMGLLKMVRSQQGEFKADNYEDEAAYAALRGECAFAARAIGYKPLPVEADPYGWITWDGGECPVSGDTEIHTIYRMESMDDFDNGTCKAGEFDWSHSGGRFDIIAYRTHKAGE
jgi:hypothetical protein